MLGHGPEGWHPDPDFFYQPGAGPLFDMGPYYLTALVGAARPGAARDRLGAHQLPGAHHRQRAEARRSASRSTHRPTWPRVLDFAGGPVATLVTSFDVWAPPLPRIEIYGTDGIPGLPDPNTFGGPVRVRRAGRRPTGARCRSPTATAENSRGLGVADMAHAMRSGRPHRASGELAYHVLDIMQSISGRRDGRPQAGHRKHLRAPRAATTWPASRRGRCVTPNHRRH